MAAENWPCHPPCPEDGPPPAPPRLQNHARAYPTLEWVSLTHSCLTHSCRHPTPAAPRAAEPINSGKISRPPGPLRRLSLRPSQVSPEKSSVRPGPQTLLQLKRAPSHFCQARTPRPRTRRQRLGRLLFPLHLSAVARGTLDLPSQHESRHNTDRGASGRESPTRRGARLWRHASEHASSRAQTRLKSLAERPGNRGQGCWLRVYWPGLKISSFSSAKLIALPLR